MPSSRRVGLAALLASLTLFGTAGCFTQVTKLDDDGAKDLFVNACTTDVSVSNGKRIENELASSSYCECVWNDIRTVHKISDDDYKAYQDRIDKGDLSNPPEEIKNAMDSCGNTPAGPAAPGSTTTTLG